MLVLPSAILHPLEDASQHIDKSLEAQAFVHSKTLPLLLDIGAIVKFGIAVTLGTVFAQETGGADNDVAPAPPSIGADVPVTYFGPAPSQVQRELIGPYQPRVLVVYGVAAISRKPRKNAWNEFDRYNQAGTEAAQREEIQHIQRAKTVKKALLHMI